MFKRLSSRAEDPGFPDAVLLTNKSQHWLRVTDDGMTIPPHSHAAIDKLSASLSRLIPQLIDDDLLVISGATEAPAQPQKTKRKRRGDDAPSTESHPVAEEPEVANLVAEPEPENWVSSNESIVGLPTTDEI